MCFFLTLVYVILSEILQVGDSLVMCILHVKLNKPPKIVAGVLLYLITVFETGF